MLYFLIAFILLWYLLGGSADASTMTTPVEPHMLSLGWVVMGCIVLVIAGGLTALWWASGTTKQPKLGSYRIKRKKGLYWVQEYTSHGWSDRSFWWTRKFAKRSLKHLSSKQPKGNTL